MESTDKNALVGGFARVVIVLSLLILVFHAGLVISPGDGFPGSNTEYFELNDTHDTFDGVSEIGNDTRDTEVLVDELDQVDHALANDSLHGSVIDVEDVGVVVVDVDDVNGVDLGVDAGDQARVDVAGVQSSSSTSDCYQRAREHGVRDISETYVGEEVFVWPTVDSGTESSGIDAYVISMQGDELSSVGAFAVEEGYAVVDPDELVRPVGLESDVLWEFIRDGQISRGYDAVGDGVGIWSC